MVITSAANRSLSRRLFLASSGLLTAHALRGQTGSVTAGQILDRIKQQVGVPWRADTVDTIKTGSPDTVVKGIATSFVSSWDVLQRAAASGKNMVIVHEPTFFNHQDATTGLTGETLTAKQKMIAQQGLVVFRFHDHWHARRPDGILAGMTRQLGWEQYQAKDEPRLFAMPATSLENVAKNASQRLTIRAVRVIGDPQLRVSRVALLPGFASLQATIRMLDRPDVDAVVIGETREWEGVEYARDAIASGKKKGLIILGHTVSEEHGMEECARWLKTFVPEVPIAFVPAGEPYWTLPFSAKR